MNGKKNTEFYHRDTENTERNPKQKHVNLGELCVSVVKFHSRVARGHG